MKLLTAKEQRINPQFVGACKALNIEPTRRQFNKFRKFKGSVYLFTKQRGNK